MCKATNAMKRLDDSEKCALLNLNDGPIQKQMHPAHALKFMDLGLVELTQGRLAHTPLGRRLARMLSTPGSTKTIAWHRNWHQYSH